METESWIKKVMSVIRRKNGVCHMGRMGWVREKLEKTKVCLSPRAGFVRLKRKESADAHHRDREPMLENTWQVCHMGGQEKQDGSGISRGFE
jgi:hypothetical protein